MLCKMGTRKRFKELQETAASGITESNKKTKHAWIVEAHESTRKRLASTLPRSHDEHIVEKGFNSISRFIFVHKFVPMHQAMKILDAKAGSGQRM